MQQTTFKVLLALVALYVLFLFQLTGSGLIGPDEPRYADVSRTMAGSGDWITPRLWNEPWFEKPPLLYWMSGAAFAIGFHDELAARLPMASLSIAFLVFYFWSLRREFGEREAICAASVLATSAGWVAFSYVAVADLPLTAMFSAAILLALRWIRTGSIQAMAWAGVFLGLAILAKGLVPIALSAPLLLFARGRWRGLLTLAGIALAVALPWHILCFAANGWPFVEELFIRHHFARFVSDSIQHVQPVWYYAPVLAGLLLPWSPALFLVFRGERDSRILLLAAIVAFGFVFFSASKNKLPGYVLPLLPAACAVIGIRAALAPRAVFLTIAALVPFLPLAARAVPGALLSGLSRVALSSLVTWPAALAAAVIAGGLMLVVWRLDRSKVGSSRVDLQACKLEYSIVSPK